MSDTAIEWTHIPGYRGRSWNPVVGCTSAGDECTFCYARELHERRRKADWPSKPAQYQRPFRDVQILRDRFFAPARWGMPSVIFVNSQSDLFHEDVPDEVLDVLLGVMAISPWHRYLILTKRAERMEAYMRAVTLDRVMAAVREEVALQEYGYVKSALMQGNIRAAESRGAWPLPNVGLGVSAGHARAAEQRVPPLTRTPAAMRFISAEPLLGPLDVALFGDEEDPGAAYRPFGPISTPTEYGTELTQGYELGIDWVLAGGESGQERGVRPMHPAWLRNLERACAAHGVQFFDKQDGAFEVIAEGPGEQGVPSDDASYVVLNESAEAAFAERGTTVTLAEGEVLMRRAGTRKAHTARTYTRQHPEVFFRA